MALFVLFAVVVAQQCSLSGHTFKKRTAFSPPFHLKPIHSHVLEPPISTSITPDPEWLADVDGQQQRLFGYPVRDVAPTQQFCKRDEDFLSWIKTRSYRWFELPSYKEEMGIWQHNIGSDKLGTYLFAKMQSVKVPQILYCSGDGPDALSNYSAPPNNNGFVVKDIHGHSSKNVFVLENGFGSMNRITQKQTTLGDIRKSFKRAKTRDIIIEELIESGHGDTAPADYKFYMFNGTVASIRVVRNRGTFQQCMAFYDEFWNRQDTFGCFQHFDRKLRNTPSFKRDKESGCFPLVGGGDVDNKKRLCSNVGPPESFSKMLSTAKRLSRRIGIFMRIDLFENAQQQVVLGELTPFCSAGKVSVRIAVFGGAFFVAFASPHFVVFFSFQYHCAATAVDGCVDSCVLGKAWKANSLIPGEPYEYKEGWERRASDGRMVEKQVPRLEGGPITSEPEYLKGWSSLTTRQKCDRIRDL